MREIASYLFTKNMKSNMRTVMAGALQSAVMRWNPAHGYMSLAEEVRRADGDQRVVEYDRIADRMVQKMRIAGVIVHQGGGKWAWANTALAEQ